MACKAGFNFLSFTWEKLYKTQSSRDMGTLYYFRQGFGRTNVPPQVKKNYAGAEALMLQVTRAHICESFMTWAGMENVEIPPTTATIQDKSKFLEESIGNFVDKYALVVPDVKGVWDMEEAQRIESEQVSNHVLPHTNQTLYRPGTTVLLLKQNSQELVPQCVLVAAGQIVEDSLRTEKLPPNEVTVQVTAVMNTKNTHNELCMGQLVAWPKKDMAIFQSEPVLLHVETQVQNDHSTSTPTKSTSLTEQVTESPKTTTGMADNNSKQGKLSNVHET
ncbi:uncharacterized protein LOC114947302 [Acropora millepora]|uniref:uncharacterized protein LOC114947302 n=1 Tax=Acropora millepora TaxID=45264 RepID=UPI001CF28EDF|nr:uncharacterized protein LOC114947302 [Acropora millepora]